MRRGSVRSLRPFITAQTRHFARALPFLESFEPGVTKVAPELKVQINKKGEDATQAEGVRMVMDVLLKITGALQRAGVPIVAGTDVGVPGHTLHRELELCVEEKGQPPACHPRR